MILFFDTETTGKVDFRMPPDHECQPHLVQLAALLTEDDGRERASLSVIVKPDGWTIPDEAAAIHGITTEIAARYGVSLRKATVLFADFCTIAETIAAHNLDFDDAVMESQFARLKGRPQRMPANRFCTMKAATPVCRIPHANPRRPDDWKWPKLEECVRIFFGEEHAGAHDALADVRACARVYFHLQSMGKAA